MCKCSFITSHAKRLKTRQHTDWTPVYPGEKINHDPMKTPLRIKTNTDLASKGKIKVRFYTVSGAIQAGLNIKIATTPQYWLNFCMPDSFRDFPTDIVLPPPDEKVWVITITRTSGVRIIVHCNGQEVLNLQLSNSLCTNWSAWSSYWNKDYDKISISSGDATFYFQFPPGKYTGWPKNV